MKKLAKFVLGAVLAVCLPANVCDAFAHHDEDCREKDYISFSPVSDLRLGMNVLTDCDYSSYPSSAQGFLNITPVKSASVAAEFLNISAYLDRSRDVIFSAGLQAVCNNYVFADKISLYMNSDRMIMPYVVDGYVRKSKLTACYLGIPVSLTFRLDRKVQLEVGGYVNYLLNAYTKYKKPINRNSIGGLNQVQAGISANVTYDGFGVYMEYGLTPLFNLRNGPEAHTMTLGILFKL